MTARGLLFLSVLCVSPLFAGGGRTLDAMEPLARETALATMQWSDAYWDDRAALLWDPVRAPGGMTSRRHLVRHTSHYAVGLLMRGGPGDREKAIRAIEAVLNNQIDEPTEPYHGTYQRYPEEPRPPHRHLTSSNHGGIARIFVDYDPDWREYIASTLIMILEEYSNQLPGPLRRRIESSIAMAVEGERQEGRLDISFTNPTAMYALMLSWAGQHLNRQAWQTEGQKYCTDFYRTFKKNDSFEYNSPAFVGLAMWRVYGPTEAIRNMGAEMEAVLWNDAASYYNANLKNLAGPWDRANAMDMRTFVSHMGLWLRMVLGPELAPMPEIDPRILGNGFVEAPGFAVLGAKIPSQAMKHFQGFVEERRVRRVITPSRVATAWIARDVMIGAQSTNFSREPESTGFHPGTVRWKMPNGDVGWIRLYRGPRLNAAAEKEMLTIQGPGDYTFRVEAPGVDARNLQRSEWTMPGLTVRLETDATGMDVKPGSGFVDIRYFNATKFTLRVAGAAQ